MPRVPSTTFLGAFVLSLSLSLNAFAAGSEDLCKYITKKDNMVCGVDMQALRAVPAVQEQLQKANAAGRLLGDQAMFKSVGLPHDDLSTMVFAWQQEEGAEAIGKAGGLPKDALMIWKFVHSLDLQQCLANAKRADAQMQVQEQEYKGAKLYLVNMSMGGTAQQIYLYQAEPDLVLAAPSLGMRTAITLIKTHGEQSVMDSHYMGPILKGRDSLAWIAYTPSPFAKPVPDQADQVLLKVDYQQALILNLSMRYPNPEIATRRQTQFKALIPVLLGATPDPALTADMFQFTTAENVVNLNLTVPEKSLELFMTKAKALVEQKGTALPAHAAAP